MAKEYDTAEIRMTARRVANVAQEVRELSIRNVKAVSEQLEGSFQGNAADALQARLRTVGSDILRISKGLDAVQRNLLSFARNLEEADRKIAEDLGKK